MTSAAERAKARRAARESTPPPVEPVVTTAPVTLAPVETPTEDAPKPKPKPNPTAVKDSLARPKTYPHRMTLDLTEAQFDRLADLSHRHRPAKKAEIVRAILDTLSDDQIADIIAQRIPKR